MLQRQIKMTYEEFIKDPSPENLIKTIHFQDYEPGDEELQNKIDEVKEILKRYIKENAKNKE